MVSNHIRHTYGTSITHFARDDFCSLAESEANDNGPIMYAPSTTVQQHNDTDGGGIFSLLVIDVAWPETPRLYSL